MNMSYCRFRNTLGDLNDCIQNFAEPVSKEEAQAREDMVVAMINFLEGELRFEVTDREGDDVDVARAISTYCIAGDECPECGLPEDECECNNDDEI